MRKRILLLLVTALTALSACEKQPDQNIWCHVTFNTVLSDGSVFLSMEVDPQPDGNFLRNLNTQQDFDFPVFVNGSGQVRLLKGMYYLAFDAQAVFPDGTRKRVRCTQYNSPEKSIALLEDTASVEIQLTVF